MAGSWHKCGVTTASRSTDGPPAAHASPMRRSVFAGLGFDRALVEVRRTRHRGRRTTVGERAQAVGETAWSQPARCARSPSPLVGEGRVRGNRAESDGARSPFPAQKRNFPPSGVRRKTFRLKNGPFILKNEAFPRKNGSFRLKNERVRLKNETFRLKFIINPDGTGFTQITAAPGLNLLANWGVLRVQGALPSEELADPVGATINADLWISGEGSRAIIAVTASTSDDDLVSIIDWDDGISPEGELP
jgi:hypothetical protein